MKTHPLPFSICEAARFVSQKPVLVDSMELTRFHTDDYVDFLRTVTPDNMHDHLRSLKRSVLFAWPLYIVLLSGKASVAVWLVELPNPIAIHVAQTCLFPSLSGARALALANDNRRVPGVWL